MATFNNAHHESGGVVLFNGELILLFSENVNLTVPERNENETGKLYLTTHRMIFINNSMSRNLKSLSIPFYTMQDLKLEQPIFGANYIQGKATEAVSNKKFSFKLKFSHGGATEYGQALSNAARAVQNMTRQSGGFQPPPPYTNTASQYYQAPPNVYQPAYNCGFALPNDIFNQPPPAGFIYASEAPPPYPGLNNPSDSKQSGGYPPQQSQSGYPPQQQQYGGYPPQQQQGGYPPQQQQGGYPSQQQQGGYPSQQQQGGYPSQQQQGGYPSQQQQGGYPSQPGFAGGMPPGYPGSPQQQQASGGGYPSQPGFAPQNNPTTTNEQHQQSSMYPRLDDFPSAPPSAPPPPQ